MAPLARKVVKASALLAASAAAVSAAPTIIKAGSAIAPVGLAKAITRKITSTGGLVTYAGNAAVYGYSPSGTRAVDYQKQFAYFAGADTDLLGDVDYGVAFSAMPIEAIQTGYRTVFNPAFGPNTVRNSYAGDTQLVEVEPYVDNLQSSGYNNYVVVEFDINAPTGDLSINYAMCTSRIMPIGADTSDLFLITLTDASDVEVPINMLNGQVVTVGQVESQSPSNWVDGFLVGLGTNVTKCLTAETATENVVAGTYTLRITTSQFGGFTSSNNIVNSGPIFSFVSASVVTNGVDSYLPTGDDLTTADAAVSGTIDTWCVLADGASTDFTPGFRMEGVNAGGNVCCKKLGFLNGDRDRCQVQMCGGPIDEYTEFVEDPDSNSCYVECKLPSAIIGSDPELDLAPALEAYWDDRVDPIQAYSGVDTAAAFADNTVGANRRYVLAWSDDVATTGVGILSGGDLYACKKRGVMDVSGCFIGCATVTTDYLALGAAPGSRCFSECYRQL